MTLDTLVKKLRKHENKLMDCTGITLIVGTSLASSGYLMYTTIDAASKGEYVHATVAGVLSVFCAFWGGYHSKAYSTNTRKAYWEGYTQAKSDCSNNSPAPKIKPNLNL